MLDENEQVIVVSWITLKPSAPLDMLLSLWPSLDWTYLIAYLIGWFSSFFKVYSASKKEHSSSHAVKELVYIVA